MTQRSFRTQRRFRSLSLITTLSIALILSTIVVRSSLDDARQVSSSIDTEKIVSIANNSGNKVAQAKIRSFVKTIADSTQGMKIITSGKRKSVLDKVKEVVASDDVQLHVTEGEFPALEDAQVAELANGQVLATIPVKGEVVEPSNITAVFNADGTLSSLNESLFRPLDEDSGRLTMWRDGQLVFDMMADSAGNVWEPTAAEPAAASNEIELVNSQWWHFNKCLTQAGVSQWAITLLGIACGVACAVTLGIGCIICLTGVGVIGGATIGWCAGRARQHLPQ